jgi:hypothetical protein
MTHPTQSMLLRLYDCMTHVYAQPGEEKNSSLGASGVSEGLVCVARSDGHWYRAQIALIVHPAETAAERTTEEEKTKYQVRFVDEGGYGWVILSDLRKIRSDFLQLPFQVS